MPDLRLGLVLVPALPLLGVGILILGGRWVSDRASAWLATILVGLSFLVSVAMGARTVGALGQGGEGAPPAVTVSLWKWVAAGEDLVELTVARRDLAVAEEIGADDVTTAWWSTGFAGMAAALPEIWDPQAVIGQRPLPAAIPAGSILARTNVPPRAGSFVPIEPRRQYRFEVDAALRLDGLSLIMIWVVAGVGFLIHLYGIGYMKGDPGLRRFFVYMNLFVFGMLVLVLGANLLVLFVGWELVGLCSYLLIGFWYRDMANASAGRKAFIVNRVGDFAFLLGLMLAWSVFGSLAYGDILAAAGERLATNGAWAVSIAALLLVGATGKSAQIPLFVWLPDAMAGPTPVSALIHAATMVTAGVYMIARLAPLYSRAPVVLAVVAGLGAITGLVAALAAMAQPDIKRVLAYSTISQVGYMFLGVGAGVAAAAIFHLVTHAFYKALLFLAAGGLMHAMDHGFEEAKAHPEAQDGVPAGQDLRHMGGLLARQGIAGWTLIVGGLSLAGLFPLAGFFSKDEILHAVLTHPRDGGPWLGLAWIGMLTAALTAFYTGRLLILALAGRPRSRGAERAATFRLPLTMAVPLVLLAGLVIIGGALGLDLAGRIALVSRLLGAAGHETLGKQGPTALSVALLATAMALAGLAAAWLVYRPGRPAPTLGGGYRATAAGLARQGFYVDALYDRLFVRPYRQAASLLWLVVDDRVIDGVVNGVGRSILACGQLSRRAQTGLVRQYALSILLGVIVIVAFLLLRAP